MTKSFMQSKKETAAGLFGRALSAWPASRLVLEIVKTLHCMKSDRLKKKHFFFLDLNVILGPWLTWKLP